MQRSAALLGLLLEGLRGGREVRVLVAEELVGDLAGEDDADVGALVDGLADEVHADARADGRDVVGAEQQDHVVEGREHLLRGHRDLGVVAADVVGRLTGVLEVDGVFRHADREGLDGLVELARRDGADEGGVEAAREQEADLGVSRQALADACDELVVDLGARGLEVVGADLVNCGDVAVADELSVLVVVSRREGHDRLDEPHEVFGLAREDDGPAPVVAVVERADADGVAPGDEALGLRVIDDAGELRVEQGEEVGAVFAVQRQDDLAVAVALELVALRAEHLARLAELVELPVADDVVAVELEGLHALGREAHDREPMETEQAMARVDDARAIGAA